MFSSRISYNPHRLDRRFIFDDSDGLITNLERMGVAAKAAHHDLILEIEPTLPLPIKSFENKKRYRSGDVLDQGEFYRRPDYLLLADGETNGRLESTYLNCFCMRFWGKQDYNYKSFNPREILKPPYDNLKRILVVNNIDILVVNFNDNFIDLNKFLKDNLPDKLLLIFCDGWDRFEKGNEDKYNKMAEVLREKGFYAFSHDEAMDRQEYLSRLIAHGLGKAGIDRLKITPRTANS